MKKQKVGRPNIVKQPKVKRVILHAEILKFTEASEETMSGMVRRLIDEDIAAGGHQPQDRPGTTRPMQVLMELEQHEYLKKIGINASRLLDRAIFELRKVTHRELVIILQTDEGKWARGDSNARSSPCEGDVITS